MNEAFIQALVYFGVLGLVALGVAIKVLHDDKRREREYQNKNITDY